jgi:sugar lactone lactonase YvrE
MFVSVGCDSSKFKNYIYILAVLCLFSAGAQAGVLTGSADVVLGQYDYTHSGANLVDAKGLNYPFSIAIDTNTGRIYVSDSYNNRVLWWNNSSSLTTGKPADGVIGQTDLYSNTSGCTQTGMSWPTGLSVDGHSNLWVADYGNNRVLKFNAPVSATGEAADLVLGQADFTHNTSGCTKTAMLGTVAVCVDSSGNVWVADAYNNRVLKFNTPSAPTGEDADLVLGQADFTHKTAACNSTGMQTPFGVYVDNSGNVWVADYDNNRVIEFNAPSAATGEDADLVLGQIDFDHKAQACTATGITAPDDVKVDSSGNVWVSDSGNNRVLKFNTPAAPMGEDADLALGQANLTSNETECTQQLMNYPCGIEIDSSGNIWVADTNNSRVLKFNTPLAPTGESADLVLGQEDYIHSTANLVDTKGVSAPFDIAIDTTSGRLYAADSANNRVLWWNDPTTLITNNPADGVLGQPDFNSYTATCTQSGMDLPSSVKVDGSGNVWVADSCNNRVLKFNKPTAATGETADLVLGQANYTSTGSACSQTGMNKPEAITLDQHGNVWVVDVFNNRVLKFNTPATNGKPADLVLGQANYTSNTSACTQTGMNAPNTVSVDSSGNVWVSEGGNHRVLKFNTPISATGETADLVLGQANYTSSGSGCTQSKLYKPRVNIDPSGHIWVADSYNNRILRFDDPAQEFNAPANFVLGQPNFTTNTSACTQTVMKKPYSVAFDKSGYLWVPDYDNNRILAFKILTMSAITPNTGVNTGSVNITNLSGYDFAAGTTVKLTKTGETGIPGTGVSIASSNKLTCTFDLTGKATGYWNVAVSTGGAGSLSSILANAFLISPPAPAVPTSLVVSTRTANSLTLTWHALADAVRFKVMKSTDNAAFSVLTSTITVYTYTVSGLIPATTYYFAVYSYNSYNVISLTSATVRGATLSFPAAPTNLVVSTSTIHSVSLTWLAPGSARFKVLRSTSNVTFELITDTITHTAHTICRLCPATTYYFKVYSYNTLGALSLTCASVNALTPATKHPVKDICSSSMTVTEPQVHVEIPQGALFSQVYLDINHDPLNYPKEVDTTKITSANSYMYNNGTNLCVSGAETEFNLYYSTGGLYNTPFAKDVLISLSYNDANNDGKVDGTNPAVLVDTLKLYVLNQTTGRWDLISSTLDKVNKNLTALVQHFSVYTLIGQRAAALDLGGIKAYPNPYRPGSGGSYDRAGGILFTGLTVHAEIKIFNIAGELVYEAIKDNGLSDFNWLALNNSGNRVASGVYIVLIKNAAEKKLIKIAIEK